MISSFEGTLLFYFNFNLFFYFFHFAFPLIPFCLFIFFSPIISFSSFDCLIIPFISGLSSSDRLMFSVPLIEIFYFSIGCFLYPVLFSSNFFSLALTYCISMPFLCSVKCRPFISGRNFCGSGRGIALF